MIFTKIIDPDIVGERGCPKMIEVYVNGTVDLGEFDLVRSSNGQAFGASSTDTRSLSGVFSNQFIYIYFSTCGEQRVLNAFPDLSGQVLLSMSNASGNGDDGFQLINRNSGDIIDQLMDGSGVLKYQDGCMERLNGTGPLGYWEPSHWQGCGGTGNEGNHNLSGLEGQELIDRVGFGNYGLGPTPVKWVELGVEPIPPHSSKLFWSTTSEKNNAYFEVIRMDLRGKEFNLGRVEPISNPEEISNYSFVDNFITGEKVFYKVKQVDHDGKSDYSPVVTYVPQTLQRNFITIHNPEKRKLKFILSPEPLRTCFIQILDLNGRIWIKERSSSEKLVEGFQTDTLPAGIYLVILNLDGKLYWEKIRIN